ncbi:MAG: chemotaxis response regulator protein-glutamate methylesterase [Gammaproteobacteria bacterium]|nr:chemotaxis response regulator protein-glutamate methylesterase [Gammaproteobacteria bacterium]MCF6229922.1 chemotaxis response regulator protein-glutamate methylesterase [Gammaproteobacteria bacterium]
MTDSNNKIKVLIVDDSALVRQILSEILNADPGVEVIGTAGDPLIAREKIKALNPDVITLDIEMPKMDGITFLRNLMRLRPMPVLMISTLTEKGADVTLEALELGAIDYIAKPKIDLREGLAAFSQDIIEKVKSAATANLRHHQNTAKESALRAPVECKRSFKFTNRMIAIGSSTGGPEALKEVLIRLPADSPPVVIAQHIPEAFSGPFARRMNGCCSVAVCEAEEGQKILPGHVYVAPGNSHLRVEKSSEGFVCRLGSDEKINRHRPSVEVLFDSVAEHVGKKAVAIMLTGMGADGADGMKRLHDRGAYCIAQDEKTSVVWGMPGEAVKRGATDEELPLEKITQRIMAIVSQD